MCVVVFAALAGLGVSSWGGTPGAQEEAPGTGDGARISTYEKRVTGNPGLPYTETFAASRCDRGDRLLSGGFYGVDEGTAVIASAPDDSSSQEDWLVGWENDSTPDAVEVSALCADEALPPHEEGSEAGG